MISFSVLDLETTGTEPPEAEVIEVACCRVQVTSGLGQTVQIYPPVHELFRPHGPITPESRAIHHISPTQVEGRPICEPKDLAYLSVGWGPDYLVAHNADFEQKWFTPEVVANKPWICTYKCALRVWPDAPRHGNQVLRYWLEDNKKIPVLGRRADPAHRAGPDTLVTAYLLRNLLELAPIEDLLAWTKEPRLMHKITFGKHRDKQWHEVPKDYLDWIMGSDMDADTKWNAQREIDRRKAEVIAQRQAAAK